MWRACFALDFVAAHHRWRSRFPDMCCRTLTASAQLCRVSFFVPFRYFRAVSLRNVRHFISRSRDTLRVTMIKRALFLITTVALLASLLKGSPQPAQRESLERRVADLESQVASLRKVVESQQGVLEILKEDYDQRHKAR